MSQQFPPSLLVVSPVLTRVSVPASSVSGINTTQLGDGCLVFCSENKRGYQLNRSSTASPDGVTVIEPLAGPGRWLIMPSGSSVTGLLTRIVWRPSGGGDAVTFDDVMTLIGSSPNVEIYIDEPVSEDTPYHIPAGVYDMLDAFFSSPENGSYQIKADAGAELRYLRATHVQLNFDASGGPNLTWPGRSSVAFSVGGEALASVLSSGVGFVIDTETNQSLELHVSGVAAMSAGAVRLGAGSSLSVVAEGLEEQTFFDGWLSSVDNTASAAVFQDGTFGEWPTIAGFTGTLSNNALGMDGGRGPTSLRPASPAKGVQYFDETLGLQIVYVPNTEGWQPVAPICFVLFQELDPSLMTPGVSDQTVNISAYTQWPLDSGWTSVVQFIENPSGQKLTVIAAQVVPPHSLKVTIQNLEADVPGGGPWDHSVVLQAGFVSP